MVAVALALVLVQDLRLKKLIELVGVTNLNFGCNVNRGIGSCLV